MPFHKKLKKIFNPEGKPSKPSRYESDKRPLKDAFKKKGR